MKRGRPFEPGNQFGRGRPKGSPNKKTLQAQKLLEDNSVAIMAMALNQSRQDPTILRTLIGPLLPRPKDVPVHIGPLPLKTLEDLDRASERLLRKATTGKISLADAQQVSGLIDDRRNVLITRDLERRVSVIEQDRSDAPPK